MLNKLYGKYGKSGLEILAFPSFEMAKGEPRTAYAMMSRIDHF